MFCCYSSQSCKVVLGLQWGKPDGGWVEDLSLSAQHTSPMSEACYLRYHMLHFIWVTNRQPYCNCDSPVSKNKQGPYSDWDCRAGSEGLLPPLTSQFQEPKHPRGVRRASFAPLEGPKHSVVGKAGTFLHSSCQQRNTAAIRTWRTDA